MGIFAVVNRLPVVVFMALALIGTAWYLQATGTPPEVIGVFLGSKVLILLELAVVLLPYAAAFVGLIGVIYLAAHHLDHAIAAGISAVCLLVIDLVWHLGVGLWVTAHLTGGV